jgi:hypothetical protein
MNTPFNPLGKVLSLQLAICLLVCYDPGNYDQLPSKITHHFTISCQPGSPRETPETACGSQTKAKDHLQKLLQKAEIICYTDRAVRIATVTSQRQITLLQDELEAVGVVPGDEFIVSVEKGIIVLTPKPENINPAHTTS